MVVNELRSNELAPYLTALMAFVNCVIIATEDTDERIRIRNEFIGEDFIQTTIMYYVEVGVVRAQVENPSLTRFVFKNLTTATSLHKKTFLVSCQFGPKEKT